MEHTSIVYFHGMGTPKRYEELSRVLDAMDRYSSAEIDKRDGTLRGQNVGLEPSRCGDDEPVSFFKFIHFTRGADSKQLRHYFRLYESYWSPAAAGAASAFGVLIWLLGRTFHPFMVLGKPWRAHQRLKRTYLNRMFYDRGAMPAVRFRQLAAVYRDFEGMNARRSYPHGTFAEFIGYLTDRYGHDSQAHDDLLVLAEHWKRSLRRAQLGIIGLAVTAYAGLFGMAVGGLFLVAAVASLCGVEWQWVAALVLRAGAIPAWIIIIVSIGFVLLGGSVTRFLELFLSDVVFWTTTLEKDVRYRKRREILKAAEDMLCHVLADTNCRRIVIIGHSLGTAIAYQTLLNLGQRLKAERDSGAAGPGRYDALQKISHIISLGSPIDRINYFFHLTFSRYHRFNRVADELMGVTSDLPFKDGKQQIIKWINIRDRADPIGSRLFSPRGVLPNRDEIQEVEVSSSHCPNPGAAHTGYFECVLAAKVLFDTAVLGRTSLQLQTDRPRWSLRAADVLRKAAWSLSAKFALLFAVGAIGFVAGSITTMRVSQFGAAAVLGLLVAVWVGGAVLDRIHRLSLPS